VFTWSCHQCLMKWIQSTHSCHTSLWPILISSFHSSKRYPSFSLPLKLLPHTCYSPCPCDTIIPVTYDEQYKWLPSKCHFLKPPVTSYLLCPNMSSAPGAQTPSAYVPPWMQEWRVTPTKTRGKIMLVLKF